ncbi:ATP-binding protein [Phakopsora pachyrhizi]|uniref:ATP-binding protein n=1 Tax=Phakopsora pachyrhizi TaxID=170000 RepID=A0AAV0BMM5_PHAPC|nr:ATP-binding protein [Phakopsora pachyrhizi]
MAQLNKIQSSEHLTALVPDNAPNHCPGLESKDAGQASACQGCPNQSICQSNEPGSRISVIDPDINLINQRLSGVKNKILVLSGKGGVGKSTFSVGLGWAFSGDGDHTALLDIDITGPSLPLMLGLSPDLHRLHSTSTGWSPLHVTEYLSVMSIGFMLPSSDSAVIWRGPKKNGMIKQFLKDVDWSTEQELEDLSASDRLDHMIIDTPPGTTDEHLSIASYLKTTGITGAVILTTPQEVAIQDVRRIISFCRKTSINILGVVENMSGFVCSSCDGQSEIFLPTSGGAKRLCKEEGLELLGKIPLDPRIGKGCDLGQDWLSMYPDSPATKSYYQIADRIKEKIEETSCNTVV